MPHFRNYPIHWAIGQADDLLPDGSRRGFPTPIDFGLIPAGVVNEWAIEHHGNWPIHTAGLLMRTDSLRATADWAGIPYDDIVMFAGLSQMGDGYYDEALTWLYRMHPKQIHRTEASQSLSEVGRRFALQRVAAVLATQILVSRVIGLRIREPHVCSAGRGSHERHHTLTYTPPGSGCQLRQSLRHPPWVVGRPYKSATKANQHVI